MKIKEKRLLKNGAIAGYVYYAKENKWKWRIIGRNNKKGGSPHSLTLIRENHDDDCRYTIDDIINPNYMNMINDNFRRCLELNNNDEIPEIYFKIYNNTNRNNNRNTNRNNNRNYQIYNSNILQRIHDMYARGIQNTQQTTIYWSTTPYENSSNRRSLNNTVN
jgi:hypothetical protein